MIWRNQYNFNSEESLYFRHYTKNNDQNANGVIICVMHKYEFIKLSNDYNLLKL